MNLILKNNINHTPVSGSSYWTMVVDAATVASDRQKAWTLYQSNGDPRMQTLNQWVAFAQSHNKQLVIQEWGAWLDPHGGGDNAYYIQQMYNFVSNPNNSIAWHSYFEVYAHDGGRGSVVESF